MCMFFFIGYDYDRLATDPNTFHLFFFLFVLFTFYIRFFPYILGNNWFLFFFCWYLKHPHTTSICLRICKCLNQYFKLFYFSHVKIHLEKKRKNETKTVGITRDRHLHTTQLRHTPIATDLIGSFSKAFCPLPTFQQFNISQNVSLSSISLVILVLLWDFSDFYSARLIPRNTSVTKCKLYSNEKEIYLLIEKEYTHALAINS